MRDLSAAFAQLNPEQREAVTHLDNLVVRAGPGSGKTATLVVKVAHLLSSVIAAPRGLACITFGREAANEFRVRLASLGVHPGSRLFLGTVHGFCLKSVLRPFGEMLGDEALTKARVATDRTTEIILQRALDQVGVNDRPSYFRATLSHIRKCLACGEDVSGFDARHVAVATLYEGMLDQQGVLDFDRMIFESLRLIRTHAVVRDVLAARFPWLVVDEYQDLGGPLHQIVRALSHDVGVKVFAVGDVDQTVFGFTGADARYLEELVRTDGYRTIRLRFNYRSGRRIIAACEAALAPDAPRGYLPDPQRSDPGEVYIHTIGGGLIKQVEFLTGTVLPAITGLGVPLHETAVLYPGKGVLLTRLQEGLAAAGVPFHAEREGLFSRTPFVKWLQKCANWALGSRSSEGILFEDLFGEYSEFLRDAGAIDPGHINLEQRRRFFSALDKTCNEEYQLGDWLNEIQESLDLRNLLQASKTNIEDLDELEGLLRGCLPGHPLVSSTLGEFARDGRVRDRIVLTTYHSSKGRQFEAVILPGLQEGIMPGRRVDRRRGVLGPIADVTLAAQRRLFYVGLSRAKRFAFLLHSDPCHDSGFGVPLIPSRFIAEVQDRLTNG